MRAFALVILAGCATTPIAPIAPARIEPVAPPATPDALLVVSRYAGSREDIALADIERGVCDGTIAAVVGARAKAEARFRCGARETSLEVVARSDALAITDLAHVTSEVSALRVDGISPLFAPDHYPLATNGAALAHHFTRFVMTGASGICRGTGWELDRRNVAWLTENLRPVLAGADYVHVSNEVSIVRDCKYVNGGTLTFCSKERDFQALLDVHANVIELTGNHNRDYGDAPARSTLAWYAQHGIKTFGGGADPDMASRALVLDLADGKKLGVLGFNEVCEHHECALHPGEVGANPWDDAKAFAAIANLRERDHVDLVFVTLQFREWDSPRPTPTQISISHALVDHGVDLVHGSQAHQLQRMEFYKGKPIYYGLGNFLFDQVQRPAVRQAFFVQHFFWDGKLVQSVPVFTFMPLDRQPTLATPNQAAAMKAIVLGG